MGSQESASLGCWQRGFAFAHHPGVCSQQVCLIRPLPQSLQMRMCQTASLTLQVFLPLRRIQENASLQRELLLSRG